ncbi:alpha/beta hydrolase fold domain-containing protein [Streptomyces cirratus]|uniref:alpha/beta hydrolase fold domain-containing protein n=1 Tax=Streptomyces cirratus TaxID=68187 RepID=UPI00361B48AA
MAKERGDLRIVHQVLFYPVTDAAFDTGSYRQFAEGYFLRREVGGSGTSTGRRGRGIGSPLPAGASIDELTGLPPALVITAEADVLRDEGEAYAAKLRAAGVPVTALRVLGTIHDFVMLNRSAVRARPSSPSRSPPPPCARPSRDGEHRDTRAAAGPGGGRGRRRPRRAPAAAVAADLLVRNAKVSHGDRGRPTRTAPSPSATAASSGLGDDHDVAALVARRRRSSTPSAAGWSPA